MKKNNLESITNVLSRNEMKNIIAGGAAEWQPGDPCTLLCCITDNNGTTCRNVCTVQGCW